MKIMKFSMLMTVLAALALQIQAAEPPICYEYFEGDFQQLPDFDQITQVAEGEVYNFGLVVAQRPDAFALRFKTCLVIEHAGEYEFCLTSDDGSKLLVDGQVVVDNDGTHGPCTKCGWIYLNPGEYYIEVQYFEHYGDQELSVLFGLDGTPLIPLENAYIKSPKPPVTPHPEPEPESEVKRKCRGDLSIGTSNRRQVGKGIVNSSGRRQKSTSGIVWGKNSLIAVMRNEGTHRETFRLRGSKGKSYYRVKYRDGSKNITSKVIRGKYKMDLAPGAKKKIRVEVTPNGSYKYGKRVDVVLKSRGSSASCVDKVRACLVKGHH